MKFNIGRVPQDYLDDFGMDGVIADTVYENQAYDFQIEFTDVNDSIILRDGCNRYLPINASALSELITALTEIRDMCEQMVEAEVLGKYISSDAQVNP